MFTDRMFLRIPPRGISGPKDLYELKHLSVYKIVLLGACDIFLHLVPSNGKKFQTPGIIWGKHANLCCEVLTYFIFCKGGNVEKAVGIEGRKL